MGSQVCGVAMQVLSTHYVMAWDYFDYNRAYNYSNS